MHFAVRFVRRRGRLLTDVDISNQPHAVGDLSISDCTDARLRRVIRSASLRPQQESHTELLPPLYDVHILGMTPIAFSLTGFEYIDGTEYAQTWLVCDVGHAYRPAKLGR